jgi:hypothetical protein
MYGISKFRPWHYKAIHEDMQRIWTVLALSAEDHGFDPRSEQTKDYKICIWCFSAKDIALRRHINKLVGLGSD